MLDKAVEQAEDIREQKLNVYYELLFRRALLYFKQEKIQQALKQFEEAYEVFEDPDDLHAVALCYVKMGELSRAVKYLEELYCEWENPKYLLFLSDLLLSEGKRNEVLKKLETILEETEDMADGDLNKIKSYYENMDNYTVDISEIIKRESVTLMENSENSYV